MSVRQIGAFVLLAVSLSAGGLSLFGGRLPAPSPAPLSVGVLAGVSRADASNIRDFYAAAADIVVRDGASTQPQIKTTGDLRMRHESALRMAFENTGIVGRYPGLGERLDEYLLKAIGDTDVPLDRALRDKAAQAFLSVK